MGNLVSGALCSQCHQKLFGIHTRCGRGIETKNYLLQTCLHPAAGDAEFEKHIASNANTSWDGFEELPTALDFAEQSRNHPHSQSCRQKYKAAPKQLPNLPPNPNHNANENRQRKYSEQHGFDGLQLPRRAPGMLRAGL